MHELAQAHLVGLAAMVAPLAVALAIDACRRWWAARQTDREGGQ